MPARRTLAPLAAALAAAALVVGAVRLAGDRPGGAAPPTGPGGSPQVLHIGKPITYGQSAKGTGRFVVIGDLSGGPTSAAVRRVAPAGDLTARVAALADALGLDRPVRHGDEWRATRGPAVLLVSTKAGNAWSYAPAGDACPLPTDPSSVACGAVALPSTAPAVDPATARAQAERVLRAADPTGCSPCRASWDPVGSPQAQYETAPAVDGTPVLGYVSTAAVTASGVIAASGWLGGSVTGATYPLISPSAALAQLANGPQPAIACAAPSPGGTPASDLPLICRSRVEVTGVRLALSLAWDGTRPVLVPTWQFTVAGSSEHPQVVAVDPAYLADPASPTGGAGGGSTGSSGSGSSGSGSSGSGSGGSTGSGGSPVPPDAVTVAPEPAVS